jgi:hypothetical protein
MTEIITIITIQTIITLIEEDTIHLIRRIEVVEEDITTLECEEVKEAEVRDIEIITPETRTRFSNVKFIWIDKVKMPRI